MGAKFTDEPEDATHVVTKGISRTEKFLCALPHAPFFVREQWVHDSINAGELTGEKLLFLFTQLLETDEMFRGTTFQRYGW